MLNCKLILIAMFVTIIGKQILSLQVIPERAMKTYVNEKYLYENATINVRRYGRKSGYYINIIATLKTQFGNNVSLTLIFLEYLHNEYKRSFVEMRFKKICDTVNNDPYIGGTFRQIGFVCPLPAGTHKIMNLTVPAENFPNVWPFERCKVKATLTQNQTNDTIATADIFVLFKQKLRVMIPHFLDHKYIYINCNTYMSRFHWLIQPQAKLYQPKQPNITQRYKNHDDNYND